MTGLGASAGPSIARQISVPRGRLNVVEFGAGPAVVLIHGFSLDRTMWATTQGSLANDHRVVTYDLRGSGASSPADPASSHLDDLLELLDALGVARAHLVGLSLGANVALAAAAYYPDRVDRVVLVSPGLPGFGWSTPRPPDEAAAVARADGADAAKEFWRNHELFASARAKPEAWSALTSMLARFDASTWHGGPAAQPLPPVAEVLDSIAVPTLIVTGEHDVEGYRAIGAHLAAWLAAAKHVVVADAGHLVNLEQPDTFNGVLDTFIRGDRA